MARTPRIDGIAIRSSPLWKSSAGTSKLYWPCDRTA
jgi:hypothetical protein